VTLRIVGAGLGRTGTLSLKAALERLLGGRCYHMLEAGERAQDVPVWHAAVRDEPVDWAALLAEYVATVDWPACAFWEELAAANPDAPVLLSSRATPEQWWASMERTIVPRVQSSVPADHDELARHRAMVIELLERFDPHWHDPAAAMAAYEAHNERVRATVAPSRLIDWRPGDGWEPICDRLGLSVPGEDFPHENTTAEFRARAGLDE
jgi:hypothetical protein